MKLFLKRPVALAISLLVWTGSPSLDLARAADQAGGGALDRFDEVRKELEESLKGTIPCFDFREGTTTCSFSGMCSRLSQSGGGAYLYQNDAGERIPNFALFGEELGAAQCFSLTKAEETDLDAAQDERTRAQKDHQRRSREAGRKFHQAIKDHGEEALWFDLQWLQSEELAEKGDGAFGGMMMVGMKREELDKDLARLEAKLGKSLSKESREALLDTQVLMFNMPQLGNALHSAPKEWQPLNDNPFLNLPLFISAKAAGGPDKVKANLALYQKEAERSHRLFRDTQQEILKYLDSKKTDENAAQIENLKTRIATISMRFLPLNMATTGQMAGMFGCAGPNAFYNPEDHTFMLCPQIMQMPGNALQMIIAHELGHSIDPCTPSDALVRIEGERRPEVDFMGNVMDEKKKEEYRKLADKMALEQGLYSYEVKIPGQNADQEAARDVRVNFMNSLSDFELKRQYKTYKRKDLSAPIPFSGHPFQETVRCLAGKDSVGARLVTEKEAAAELDEWIRAQIEAGATPEKSPAVASMMKARDDVGRLLKDRGGCSFIPGAKGNSQVQEGFADKLASEILARKLAKATPADAKRLAFEASSFFLSMDCPGLAKKVHDKVDAATRGLKCREDQNKDMKTLNAIYRSMRVNRDEHSKAADRINRILMVHPTLRKAAGCPVERGVKYCE